MRVPTKATYERFETDGAFHFDFFLAEKLRIGTVAELRARMSNEEWHEWFIYYSRKGQEAEMARATAGG